MEDRGGWQGTARMISHDAIRLVRRCMISTSKKRNNKLYGSRGKEEREVVQSRRNGIMKRETMKKMSNNGINRYL